MDAGAASSAGMTRMEDVLQCSVMRKEIKWLVTATNLYATFFRGPLGYDKLRTAGYGSRGAFSRGREKRRVY